MGWCSQQGRDLSSGVGTDLLDMGTMVTDHDALLGITFHDEGCVDVQ